MKKKYILKNPLKWRKILSEKNILLKEFAQSCSVTSEQISRIFSFKKPQKVGEYLRKIIQNEFSKILGREIKFNEIWKEIKE